MRITNKMMTNNVMNSINRNKNKLNDLESQYTSGKKIQKPSDDPIIAVRALKLRSNISELEQYKEKNIPDAMSWMEVSESAINNINELIKKMNDYCVQGANDTLSVSARSSITDNLAQLKAQIYQECNANYAGRYVFSGFKTNSSLTFENGSQDIKYNITQTFAGADIEKIQKVIGEYKIEDFKTSSTREDFKESPLLNEDVYRIKLAYDNLDEVEVSVDTQPYMHDIKYMKSTDEGAYEPKNGEMIVIRDTGEIIMNNDTYAKIRDFKEDEIKIDYQKTVFKTGDVKPEHYFNCTSTNQYGDVKNYEKATQDIFYEVNFSQSMKVNTQLSHYLGNEVAREIDELITVVQDVENVEKKMEEVEKLLADPNLTATQTKALEAMKEQLSTEFVLKSSIMTGHFEKGIEHTNDYQTSLNIALADLGSRYQRLELTQSRLGEQADDFTELLSTNEDVDLVETYVNLSSAESIYTASLNAASKIAKNSLLDFI
ncbi:MAG: flagellar hook-associated protein FlgL [Lachnospiraceae bacterium]|nr:flagellar hook-associated protein FlgL [Lachnospiraceae bacterium]